MSATQTVRSPLARRVATPVAIVCVLVLLTIVVLGYRHAGEMQSSAALDLMTGINAHLARQQAEHPDAPLPAELPGIPGAKTHLIPAATDFKPAVPSLVVRHSVPGSQMVLLTEYPQSEVQKRVRVTLQFLIAVITPLTIALLVMLYFIVQRQISQPLRQLLKALQDVTAGRTSRLALAEHKHDELGEVLDAVNVMGRTISARDDALQLKMQALEQELVAGQRREDAMHRLSQKLQAATESAFMGVWDWEPQTGRLEWDARMFELYGQDPDSFVLTAENWLSCLFPDDVEKVRHRIAQALRAEEPYHNVQFRVVLPEGSIRYVVGYGQVLRDEQRKAIRFVGVNVDMTEQKLAESRVLHMATHDNLTGLANRHLLSERIATAIEHASATGELIAVLYCDLDRFKNINDSHGHSTGDEVLKMVASRLMDLSRKGDTLARIGGDEFVLLMPNLSSQAEALDIAQTVLSSISESYHYSLHEFSITPSIGICFYPEHGTDAETLLRNADTALYRAKDAGRNTVRIYNQRMSEEASRLLELGNALRHAVERSQFRLHYQPKVNLASGEIIGAEALVRWQRPGQGLVPPNVFIPLAEDMGLIHDIGAWVLSEACRQLDCWQKAGLPKTTIAVNLSAVQFSHHGLRQSVETAIQRSHIDPSQLELEITESVLMQDNELDVLAMLKDFKALGVSLAIDDFGTGYSSLSYLHRYPFDTIKIDRSFIVDIDDKTARAPIVRSILSLAHSLGLKAVAEGVENLVQAEFLLAQGCPLAQGYYYSRPVPPEVFAELLAGKTLPEKKAGEPSQIRPSEV